MSGESFRFIHASDFHLETPLGDLDALPPNLHDALATAPRDAAEAIFEAALATNIDFLVLSGDLLHPVAAGPHGMSLLLDNFEKLHAAKKPVYWAAGVADDPKHWPEAVPLPPNVTLFPRDKPLSITYERAGRTICTLVGRSSEGRSSLHVPGFQTETIDDFTIGVGYGASDANALSAGRMDYWALGGAHNYREIEGGAPAGAVQPGSPQGRGLDESGPHGYCVVDVDAEQTARVHRVESDCFRYCHETIDADEIRSVGSLRNLLGQKISTLANENGGRHLLIAWDVNLTDPEMIASIGDPNELLRQIRRDHGNGNPSAWTTRLTVRPPRTYPKSWREEDTILGDFLRASDKFRKSGSPAGTSSPSGSAAGSAGDSRLINLMPFTEEHAELSSTATTLLGDLPAQHRDETLDEATLLGVELLRGGKPTWGRKS
ncbi:metallophosphoesterase family protein [Allorhodopirellula solitaria]|uniref:Putative metallophosphoesterase YhaO n=1 Tax=Allorhodopirellula solitaria TaxID=2527987 RepID=A0A5C5YJC0_9BACT|nr:DNA repair exonuclease [Allorhodopirellula solitaria]TWT74974.1 putative metallophosphoesterase YhaO [Allorhodopirellula solitaria]